MSDPIDFRARAADVYDRVVAWQRDIHAHPEIGFAVERTAGIAAAAMAEAGLVVREGVGQTGVVADLEVPGATRRIAFRADMDALPMDEENDLPHRSTIPGRAHCCGHDAHTAMLMGAATALAAHRDTLGCSLRFIFQPNEEALPGGAPAMIEDGCLDGVDRIFGMHVWPLLDTGRIGVLAGPAMGQPDTWRIVLEGKGGHAATPHETIDPIVGASALVGALQSVVARNVDPLACGVLSVTRIHAGSADNVIPERALLGGTIRSFDRAVGDLLRRRLDELAARIGAAYGLDATVEITRGYPVLVNDAGSCDAAAAALDAFDVVRDPAPTLGGEDFAYYLERVPGAFLFLGNRDEAQGIVHFCHHPRFRVDDAAMRDGLEAWLRLAFAA